MRRLVSLVSLALAACASTTPHARGVPAHAMLRAPTAGESAVAFAYDAPTCSLEIDDGAHTFVWSAPDASWEGNGAALLGVLPLAPGHYTLRAIVTVDAWEREIDPATNAAMGLTECASHAGTRRAVEQPFDVAPAEVSIVTLDGALDLDSLRRMASASARSRTWIGEWLPAVDDAMARARTRVVLALRAPREGYDLYPACDGATAIVRGEGTSVALTDEHERESLRGRVLGVLAAAGVRSVHGSGVGAGCLRHGALAVFLSDPSELAAAIATIGAWLASENLAVEIDVEREDVPQLL